MKQTDIAQPCALMLLFACAALPLACGSEFLEITRVPPADTGGAGGAGGGGGETATTTSEGGVNPSGGNGGAGGVASTGGGITTSLGGDGGTGGTGGMPIVCAADEKACGGACVKITDPAYGCDPIACEPCASKGWANVSAYACEKTACVIAACVGAFRDCDDELGNGCEADTANDATHCGSCKNVCAENACEAGICNPFCGPKKVTTQGVAICWDWQNGNDNYAIALSGIVGAQAAPPQKPLMQADNTPCLGTKTDKWLVCAFGVQPPNILLQLELIDFFGEAFYSWRCWSTQGAPFCWGTVRVWRDGVEAKPAFQDMGNKAPPPWMYVQGPNSRWRIQLTLP